MLRRQEDRNNNGSALNIKVASERLVNKVQRAYPPLPPITFHLVTDIAPVTTRGRLSCIQLDTVTQSTL